MLRLFARLRLIAATAAISIATAVQAQNVKLGPAIYNQSTGIISFQSPGVNPIVGISRGSLVGSDPSAVSMINTTASTSTATGALVVAGGVGVGGALNVGGPVKEPTPASTDNSTTAATTAWVNQFFPSLSASVQGSGVPGFGGPFLILQLNSTSPTATAFRVQRNDTYTGGSGNSYADWTACNNVGGETGFVYCKLNTFDNKSTGNGTNMVAEYNQVFQEAGSGPSWALVGENRSYGQNPTSGDVTAELDMFGHLTDANGNRVILDLVAGYVPGLGDTTTPTVTYALRFGAQNGTASNASITYGIYANPATYGTVFGAKTGASFTHGVDLSSATCGTDAFKSTGFSIDCYGDGNFVGLVSNTTNASVASITVAGTPAVGINVTATSGTAAIRIPSGQNFSWEGTSTVNSLWDGTYLKSMYGTQVLWKSDQYGNFTTGASLAVVATTASVSPTTGAIVDSGGLGVAGPEFLGGSLAFGGHIYGNGGAPTVAASTGTVTTSTGINDNHGTVVASAAATITVTFSTAYTNTPDCTVGTPNGATKPTWTVTSTKLSIATPIGEAATYTCMGK